MCIITNVTAYLFYPWKYEIIHTLYPKSQSSSSVSNSVIGQMHVLIKSLNQNNNPLDYVYIKAFYKLSLLLLGRKNKEMNDNFIKILNNLIPFPREGSIWDKNSLKNYKPFHRI